ncbi:hypothetical protein BC628DRAFT_1329420 [Trametes gibbosa]|nr:hypothetical protein BC628DRAFT_1329420 [Trametes gibbosa]
MPSPPLLTPYFPEYAEVTEHALRALLAGDVSAIRGGSTPYLAAGEEWPRCTNCAHELVPYIQINVSSEQTPAAFRAHVLPPPGTGGTTLLQLFVCAEETDSGYCFEAWTMQQVEGNGESWLLRTVRVVDTAGVGEPESVPAHDAVRAKLLEAEELLPERVISTWTAGRQETLDQESYWDYPEGFYEQHEPAEGLKLLGYPTLGKFYTSARDTEACNMGDDGPHNDWRCLIQLGTREEDNPFYTTGNIFVNQCERHPNVFDAVCAGTW